MSNCKLCGNCQCLIYIHCIAWHLMLTIFTDILSTNIDLVQFIKVRLGYAIGNAPPTLTSDFQLCLHFM